MLSSESRPKAICFDLGYTLLRHQPSGPGLYIETLTRAGFEVTPERLENAMAPAREFYIRSIRGGSDFESSMEAAIEFWTAYITMVLEGLGVPPRDRASVVKTIYTTAWSPESWVLFPEVIPTLETLLGMGLRLAVISNFVDTLDAVCKAHGLAGYFDVIVASVAAGAMKPDPRIFAATLRRLGVAPSEAWHVGDSYWTDVLGARAAGLVPVLVDREGSVPKPDCRRITSLDQLVELLGAEAAA